MLCFFSGIGLGGLAYVEYQSDPQALLLWGAVAMLLILLGFFVDAA